VEEVTESAPDRRTTPGENALETGKGIHRWMQQTTAKKKLGKESG